MFGNEAVEIAEFETRRGMGRADRAQPQGIGRHGIGAIGLARRSAWQAIEFGDARADGGAGLGTTGSARARDVEHGLDDLAISGAAAQHAAERVVNRSSLGSAFLANRSLAAISMPGVQMPHCAAPWRWNAACSASRPSVASPSTVVTRRPSA